MYFCYAYSIWIYLTWFPTYLQEARGFSLKQMGFWHMVPLIAATIASGVPSHITSLPIWPGCGV